MQLHPWQTIFWADTRRATVGMILVEAVGALAEFKFQGFVRHYEVYSCFVCKDAYVKMLSVQHCSPSILDDFYQPKVEHEILWLAGIAAAHSLGNSQRCFFVCMGIPNLNLFLLPLLNGEREGMSFLFDMFINHMYIIFLLYNYI